MVDSTKDKFIQDAKIRITGDGYPDEGDEDGVLESVTNGANNPGKARVSFSRENQRREAALIPALTAAGETPSLSAVVVRFFTPLFSTPTQAIRALKLWHARGDKSHQQQESRRQQSRPEQKSPPSEPLP